jgi:hypothetical protein
MSRELPILFNTEMVRAILDGRKTCTRRVVKPQPDEKHTYSLGFVIDSTEKKAVGCFGFGIDEYGGSIQYAKPPYKPGDILYVRETWCGWYLPLVGMHYCYRATEPDGNKRPTSPEYDCDVEKISWHPSIHMPKEAARIWLKVTDVRVQRLQDMDKMDAVKEGIDTRLCINLNHALAKFKKLWNSTIKKSDLDRYGWDANPWVWVIEFERCEKPQEV